MPSQPAASPPATTPTTAPITSTEQEFLLTDGHGGFALCTPTLTPERRYHGLLVASRRPPLDRFMLLQSIAARVVDPDGRSTWLTGYRFEDAEGVHPGPHGAAPSFAATPETASWAFAPAPDVRVTITLRLTPARAHLDIDFDAPAGTTLEIRPMTPLRDFHALERGDAALGVRLEDRAATIHRRDVGLRLDWSAGATFRQDPETWWNVTLQHELDRGYDHLEDVPSPGVVVIETPGRVTVNASATWAGEPIPRPPERAEDALATPRDRLVAAARAYVVLRETDDRGPRGLTVLAGYPWFGDWGRDTMIALPGLLLETGRLDDAATVLATFAGAVEHGIVPNRFADSGSGAEFNTADASLWFLHACAQFAAAAGSSGVFEDTLLPACRAVIGEYRRGTTADGATIAVDPADGLVIAGNVNTQLTWMDARRDGVVFTPRHGKPVELSAIWAASLRKLARFASGEEGRSWTDDADRTAASIRDKLFCDARGWCADRLAPDEASGAIDAPVWELRPNQLFAVSLDPEILGRERGRRVVEACVETLWTPRGVRTLAPDDPQYRPRFEGRMFERDAAYHQGTAWPWLMGPLVEASLNVGGDASQARRMIDPLLAELDGPCLGQLYEVYDGDGWTGSPGNWSDDAGRPQAPGGCPAQAWSVAELLRVLARIESTGG